MSAEVLADYRSLADAAEDAGISYRQADYWVTQGYIRTLTAQGSHSGPVRGPMRLLDTEVESNPGSGFFRVVSVSEARILTLMRRLGDVGIQPALAALVARQMVTTNDSACDLGRGFTLSMREPA